MPSMHCLARYGFVLGALFAVHSSARAHPAPDCHIGSYRLTDGRLVDIAPSEGDRLRWRQFDGATGALHKGADGTWKSTYGWTERTDGKTVAFSACGTGQINFGGVAGRRIAFDVKEATFESHGTSLIGRLVMPRGEARVPIVVLLHGSE